MRPAAPTDTIDPWMRTTDQPVDLDTWEAALPPGPFQHNTGSWDVQ